MTQFEEHKPTGRVESATKSVEPIVSVVIPAYSAAAYIAGTLDSVFAQTLCDFEVLLINDGSPDTEALEKELRPYLARIRYFKQPNKGPGAARNLGVREAKARYIALLDADDFWLPQHLARQIERLSRNHELGLVYANALHLRGHTPVGAAFDRVPQSSPVDLDSLLSERCTINTSSVVVLRSALFQAGLFDETMCHCEDFDLWLRLTRLGIGIEYDRQVQVGHRLGNGLASNRESMKRGRAQAYRKFLSSGTVHDSQRSMVASKLKSLDFEIHVELAKERILARNYSDALSEVRLARSIVEKSALRWTELGLICFPSGLGWAYRHYSKWLERYKHRREAEAAKKLHPGEPSSANMLIPHREAE